MSPLNIATNTDNNPDEDNNEIMVAIQNLASRCTSLIEYSTNWKNQASEYEKIRAKASSYSYVRPLGVQDAVKKLEELSIESNFDNDSVIVLAFYIYIYYKTENMKDRRSFISQFIDNKNNSDIEILLQEASEHPRSENQYLKHTYL